MPRFFKANHSFDLPTRNGVQVAGEEVFVHEVAPGREYFSIRYRFRHLEKLDVFNGICTVSVGDREHTATFDFYGSGIYARIIARRDWIDLLDPPARRYSYFDYGRSLWIQDIDGDPDAGYPEYTTIQMLDVHYDENFEVLLPLELIDDLRGTATIKIVFQGSKDSLTIEYEGGVRSQIHRLMEEDQKE